MQSPYIGRGIAFVVIVGLVAWTASRALGARPSRNAESTLPRAGHPMFRWPLQEPANRGSRREAAFGACRPFSSISREFSSVTSGYRAATLSRPLTKV